MKLLQQVAMEKKMRSHSKNEVVRWSRSIAICLAVLVRVGLSQSTSYFVDAAGGNDSNDGRKASTAWKTLSKVSGVRFQPGDSLLLKSGSVWTGQLSLQGSGSREGPIVVDTYGGTVKPRIDGNGVTGTATVYLANSKFWEINNLEITNDAPTEGDRRGVLVTASDFGLVEHIYLRNLNIHNVKGIVGGDDDAKRTAGIGIETATDRITPTRYDDVLIEGCTISTIENTGLYTDNLLSRNTPGTDDWTKRRFTNVRIRNNVIHHISKNAMIVRILDGGLVERNVCYETALRTTGNTMFTSSCSGTVFQYNEGYYNRATENTPGGGDGSMYDADLKSSNITFQYSYSHDNSHGLFWSCTVQNDSNVVCRYNISRNDKGIIFCVNYPVTSVYIYNNTVYCGPGLSPIIISERNVNQGTRTYTFRNNIIYNAAANASYDFRSAGYTRFTDYNLYYGFHPSNEPSDSNKLTTDPKLVNPGSGGIGFSTLDGYKLQQSSPCINTGVQLAGHSAQDFWGNGVPSGGKVDRGAFEYPMGSSEVQNERPNQPAQFALMQNYPNPFNPDTNIFYQLATPQHISVAIYDLSGKNVRTIKKGLEWSGSHVARWDGTDDVGHQVSSGAYFARLTSEAGSSTIRMILIR